MSLLQNEGIQSILVVALRRGAQGDDYQLFAEGFSWNSCLSQRPRQGVGNAAQGSIKKWSHLPLWRMPDFQLIANTESRGVGYLHGKIILSEELFTSFWPYDHAIVAAALDKLEDSFDIVRKATPVPSAAEQMPVRKTAPVIKGVPGA